MKDHISPILTLNIKLMIFSLNHTGLSIQLKQIFANRPNLNLQMISTPGILRDSRIS